MSWNFGNGFVESSSHPYRLLSDSAIGSNIRMLLTLEGPGEHWEDDASGGLDRGGSQVMFPYFTR
jgi:hypothetical protein